MRIKILVTPTRNGPVVCNQCAYYFFLLPASDPLSIKYKISPFSPPIPNIVSLGRYLEIVMQVQSVMLKLKRVESRVISRLMYSL